MWQLGLSWQQDVKAFRMSRTLTGMLRTALRTALRMARACSASWRDTAPEVWNGSWNGSRGIRLLKSLPLCVSFAEWGAHIRL
jgi:hypothetical protein